MLKDIKRGGYVDHIRYELEFMTDRNGGYSFPCDKDGNVLELPEAAAKNYAWCLASPDLFPWSFNEVRKYVQTVREPDTGTCSCGKRVEMVNEYMGAFQCPKCGQWYNTAGQELLPPDKWGWDGTPWDYDD